LETELTRSDARNKESSHRHIIEQQFVQIADLQKANHVLRGQLAGGVSCRFPEGCRSSADTQYPEVYRTLVRVQAERDALADGARTPTKASPPSPPPSAQSLNDIREEHASEIQALITGHVQAMQELGAEHANALQSARSAVSQTSEDASREQKAILDRIAEEHASLVTQLKATHAKALTDLQAEAEAVQSEINTALLDSEEHRRQLKLKVDQAVFELSRVKDEDAVIQQASQQKILELERVKGDLETAVSSLQDAKADVDARVGQLQKDKDEWLNHLVELQNTISDLNRRNAELESTKATSRKTTPMPPQGPPPNMPLPPTPLAAPSTPLSPTFRTSTPLTLNRSGSAGSHASLRGLGIMPQGDSHVIVTDADVDAAVNLLPPHLAHVVKSLQKQREDAVRDGERIRKVSETGRMSVMEAETSLAEHTEKANQLARELADARKTSEL
jgi:kinesin family protein 4/21/27